MKTIKIVTVALAASLFALTSAADITITGDGRYRAGIKDNGPTAAQKDVNFRDGRMRMTIMGGNSKAGIEMRIRTDFGKFDTKTVNVVAPSTVSSKIANSIRIDRRIAFFKLGGLKVQMGETGKYTGLLGTYYGAGEFNNAGTITVSGGSKNFGAWLSQESVNKVGFKSDVIRLGLHGGFQGISFKYTGRFNNLKKGNPRSTTTDWANAKFDDLTLTGNFNGAKVEFDSGRSRALNSNSLIARVSVPISGLTLKLGYAKLQGGFQNQDWETILGAGIFGNGFAPKNGALTGSVKSTAGTVDSALGRTTANKYTGLAIAGSLGNISYQLTGGTFDDNVVATSNGFYSIDTSYSLDSSTTLKFGIGRANGLKGFGASANYKF